MCYFKTECQYKMLLNQMLIYIERGKATQLVLGYLEFCMKKKSLLMRLKLRPKKRLKPTERFKYLHLIKTREK